MGKNCEFLGFGVSTASCCLFLFRMKFLVDCLENKMNFKKKKERGGKGGKIEKEVGKEENGK